MSKSYKFSCFLMGSQTRLIQCGELLLEKGHEIYGVITNDSSVKKWIEERNLQHLEPNANLVRILEQQLFDYFFSIDNFSILPNEILVLPRKYAINFHDAPLPKYAGVNATNWAIINREANHGITWHLMTEQLDAGDILKQKTFPISKGETALTLNTKCYEQSIQCFAELIDELAEDRIKPIQQNLELRTYFPRWKRPPAVCTINWSHSAEKIDALFRGLDYGHYQNPLGIPKLFLGDQIIIAKQINILQSAADMEPGTLVLITDEAMHVATRTRTVAFRDFMTFTGEPISPSVFLERSGFHVGDKLPQLGRQCEDSLTKINSKFCKYERFWIRRLENLEPIEIPYAKRNNFRSDSSCYREVRFLTPVSVLANQGNYESLGDFILAAFVLYLSRIGAKLSFDINFQDEKLYQELSDAEFFFEPYVPLHIDINETQNFGECYSATIQQIEYTKSHGSYARDLIIRTPTLRKILSNNLGRELPVAIKRVECLNNQQPKIKSELILTIPDDGKECIWLYDREILSEAAISRMQEQFAVLLNDIAFDKDRSISNLSILPEREKQKLIKEWNSSSKKYSLDGGLHNRFEAQVDRTPDAVALVYKDKRLTYRQLNRYSNQLARCLREAGVGPEVLVGICLERNISLVVGLLGILKAGGAYLPLDPTYPKERLSFMIEDSKVPVILTQRSLISNLPTQSEKILCLDDLDMELIPDDKKNDENIASRVKPEHLAYVIYTSGSTGKPKGVLISHRNVMRLFDATASWFNFGPEDVWTLFHSYAFDFSVWEIWGALVHGGRLVVVPFEVSRSPREFYRMLVQESVTVLNQTPSAFQQLIQAEEILGPDDLLGLRLIIFGGEALELQSLKPWFERHGDVRPQLVNMLGITETTVHVTYRPLKVEDVKHQKGSVIGYQIPDLQIYVLDRNMQPVPIGVPGELYVGGPCLARGYLNRPKLTKERFIPDPFSSENDARLYRTGDLVRYLDNRDLEYLGRIDQQVQIRGFRVELGEIETVLTEHKAVVQAVVVVWEDQPGEKRLVAYFVAASEHIISSTELRKHLLRKLPDYMIPQQFVEMESIPMTPSGKLDRRTLPMPQAERQTEEVYIAPQNEVEKIIAGIWQEILHVKKVGTNDSFFDLGGHSLLLMRMLVKLQEVFEQEVSVVDFFRYPTVEMLAKFFTQKQKTRPTLKKVHDLANKQKESLLKHKKFAIARKTRNEKRY